MRKTDPKKEGRRLAYDSVSEFERLGRMLEARALGATLKEIGEEWGVSGEWVRQLIARSRPRNGTR